MMGSLCVPRRRGDEPRPGSFTTAGYAVFPAGAGMNRELLFIDAVELRVPRRRGDEPHREYALRSKVCSPQARG